jgi:hypothetical protein
MIKNKKIKKNFELKAVVFILLKNKRLPREIRKRKGY